MDTFERDSGLFPLPCPPTRHYGPSSALHVCAYKGVEEADAGRHARAPGAFVCAALGVAGANIVLANAVEGCRSICLDLEPLAFCEERWLKLLAAKNLHALLR